jgi:hypothetical protein
MVRVLGSQVGCCWAGEASLEDLKKSKRPIFVTEICLVGDWTERDKMEMRKRCGEIGASWMGKKQGREKMGSGLMYF